ncbi:hypothetical protein AHAS_Ahas20G0153600 [Arachis hypogaea]
MGGKSPKVVITDGDLAMRDAIKNVLPDVTHRLCGWHLQRNACENIKNPNFLHDFKGLIYDNNDHREFDRGWAAILDKHNLVGSTWMEKTYETRVMWSHCFMRDNLSALSHDDYLVGGALNIKVLNTTLDKVELSVTTLGDPAKDRRVEVDRSKNLFSCSCKLFESRGIPCSHVFRAMKFENILEFPDSLTYKRWTKNAKNKFISTEMPVNDDVEMDLADFDEVQSELVKLVIHLQSRKQGKSTPNINVEGINDPFIVKSKGAPSKRSSWRKKRACSFCHKYGHYYKRCPDLMQHSVQGNPCERSNSNASAKDSGFSPESLLKKGRSRKFTATGMRNQKGNDSTFDELFDYSMTLSHVVLPGISAG